MYDHLRRRHQSWHPFLHLGGGGTMWIKNLVQGFNTAATGLRLELTTCWSQAQRPTRCATVLNYKGRKQLYLIRALILPYTKSQIAMLVFKVISRLYICKALRKLPFFFQKLRKKCISHSKRLTYVVILTCTYIIPLKEVSFIFFRKIERKK